MLTHRQLFLTHNAQTSDAPLLLEFERADGVFMYDVTGKSYMDLISGIGVSNVGHCHPKVVHAIHDQLNKYMHLMVYGEYVQSPQVLLAKQLTTLLPASLNNVYFTNSGSEAIEGALKLAKRYTKRTELIAFKNAYHGSSHGALSVMGVESFKSSFRPLLPDVNFLSLNCEADLERITHKTAAVIIEPIQGEAGVQIPHEEFMRKLRYRCNDVGALLILDEIQTGFGRTGKWFAFEHFNIVPDVLTIAKGMGGGMPIGAFIAPQKMMSVFKNNPILGHITTFGGHPVCCAASLATLKTIQEEGLMDGIEVKESLFKSLLVHSSIKEIRGKGLMFAVEFGNFEQNKRIIDICISNGVVVDWFLHCATAMRIAPPLMITEEQIKWACAIILAAIEEVYDSI